MNDIYASYLSDDERDFMIIESTFDNVIKHAECMYEMAILKHKMFISDAENKVLCKSGSFDDLEILYEEAGASADKAKEGIINKIITGIKNFLFNISNKTQELFEKNVNNKKIDNNSKINIEDPKEFANAIDKASMEIKSTNIKNDTALKKKYNKHINLFKDVAEVSIYFGIMNIALKRIKKNLKNLKKML